MSTLQNHDHPGDDTSIARIAALRQRIQEAENELALLLNSRDDQGSALTTNDLLCRSCAARLADIEQHDTSMFDNISDDFMQLDHGALLQYITEYKRSEEALRENGARLETLLKLNQMTQACELEITDFALEAAVRQTNSEIGYLSFLNEDESLLTMHSWSKTAMSQCEVIDTPIHYPIAETGLWGEVVRQRKPIITNDYSAPNPLKRGYPKGHVPVRRHMNIPLFDGERIVLVAGVGNKHTPYDDSDVVRLTLLMQALWKLLQRKQAAEALRLAEDKFQRAFYISPDAISINRLADGVYFEVNEGFTKITGYTAEEVIGQSPFSSGLNNWVNTADRERLLAGLREHGEVEEFEFPFRCKDGNIHICLMSARLIEFNGERCILSITRDISERKQMEMALRQSEERFKNLSSIASEGIMIHEDGVIVDANQAFVRIIGFAHPEDIIGKRALELYQFTSESAQRLQENMRSGTTEAYDLDLIHRNGLIVPVETCGRHINYQGRAARLVYMRDITERKQAEDALKASEYTHRAMVANISDVIGIIDASGIIRYKSPNITRWFGWRPDDLVGTDGWETVHPDDLARVQATFLQLLERPSATKTDEYRYMCKDGSYRLIELTAANLVHDPHINGVLMNYHDITARKQAEEERDRLQAQLAQAQKMESVGRLAGGVAHDFNNMLGVIIGNTEMAMMQVEPTEPLYSDLTEIRKAAGRSADLTKQLLAFARKQTVSPKVLSLNETIAGMLNMLRRLIGEDIDLVWLAGTDLWSVNMDPSQVDQLLANLCVNARDAIAGVGNVTIETNNVLCDETYCAGHAGVLPGAYIQLAVSDNGCGMTQETQSHLFEPFFTTKGVGEGTGLGLATVYGVVIQNHGFINVYSEPGQGTTFKIYLPRYVDYAVQLPDGSRCELSRRGQETVLLVEDEPAILRLGKRLLGQQGYHVLAATTPGEAIRLAEEYAGEIHLLLTDVVMPEMNGRDLARCLLSYYPNIKRLFMSGYTANVIAPHGVLDEGVNFLQKPFSIQDLAAKVREVLDQ